MINFRLLLAAWCCAIASVGVAADEDGAKGKPTLETSLALYEQSIAPLLAKHCQHCHEGSEAEAKLDLAVLDPNMKSTSAARWAMVLDKVVSREMPPQDEQPLKADQIEAISRWIKAEMKRSGKHLARREAYANGNKIPHAMLFEQASVTPLDAPPRIRTVSPDIYRRFSRDMAKGFENLVGQPFSPNGNTTFKDMALAQVDEPVTAQLIHNALVIVGRQLSYRIEKGEMKPIPGTRKEFLPFLDEKQPFTQQDMEKAIRLQFARVLEREPEAEELARFVQLMKSSVAESGREIGMRYALAGVFLLPEAIFRYEIGSGSVDDEGRVRLAPREIAFALSYALSDDRPPGWLITAARDGELDTEEGVAKIVQRMLDDPKMAKPRIMRFFREYFDYAKATEVFKDTADAKAHDPKALVEDTDLLVEMILAEDKQVLRELLTTNKSYVFHRGAEELKKKRKAAREKFEREKRKNPEKYKTKTLKLPGRSIYEAYNLEDFPSKQPVELPKQQRAGILTQPAWLVAFSTADDNHAILRGKWVRERLLGGVVPDIPITVDAQLPDAPEQTLRQRMAVTEQEYCWQCHQLMNRVGYPFEMYDHLGRYRKTEKVLDPEATKANVDAKGKHLGPVHREVPVDSSGGFEFTLDPKLQGDAPNAIEFVHRMAESEVVEQVFVRHVFRYFMGRNESLGDTASLRAAHEAYRASDGSMQALIVSILSSESFLYRVPSSG